MKTFNEDKCRYELIGSVALKHEFNFIDRDKEHPIFVKARDFYVNKQWNEAKHEYEKLLSINPKNFYYHHTYACILSRFIGKDIVKCMKKALKHSSIATQLSPKTIAVRLTYIGFLANLHEHKSVQKQCQILFNQLLTPQQINFSDPSEYMKYANDLSTAFQYYADFLRNICEYEDAIKYLQLSCSLQKKFYLPVKYMLYQSLLWLYIKLEQPNNALNQMATMKAIKKSKLSEWETFQSDASNDNFVMCIGEIELIFENYMKAYGHFKRTFDYLKQTDEVFRCLDIYIRLIECCIELGRFGEAEYLNNELYSISISNPSLSSRPCNGTVYFQREFLETYSLVKQGGMKNARKAVKDMELCTKIALKYNSDKGNRMPCAHFYLGLAYKKLSEYEKKEYYINKAKESLFQGAILIPKKVKFIWEFALILFETNEWYLCKKYVIKSWKQCKEAKRISIGYSTIRNKLRKQMKQLKCSFCGRNKYLKSGQTIHKLKVCKGCQKVYYCNVKCQKFHWKQSHHKQCNKIWIEWNDKLLKTIPHLYPFTSFNQLCSDYVVMKHFM